MKVSSHPSPLIWRTPWTAEVVKATAARIMQTIRISLLSRVSAGLSNYANQESAVTPSGTGTGCVCRVVSDPLADARGAVR